MHDGHEELLRHDDFLRRLARGLVGAERADDLAQETWVAALRGRAPAAGARPGAVRSWLARVARNLAIRGAERDAGRRAREAGAGRPPDGGSEPPTPTAIEARMALQRRLVEAVEGLREPYRTAVFLRYFEGLPPAEIARRTGDPVATVKTRLKRALATLRERLDDESGGREAWSAALVGALLERGPAGPPVAAPLGAGALRGLQGGAMATKAVIAGGAGATLLAAAAWWLLPDGSGEREEAGAVRTAGAAEEAERPRAAAGAIELVGRPQGPAPDRAPVEPGDAAGAAAGGAPPPVAPERAAAEEEEDEEEPRLVLRGRVVHAEGPPAADAHVLLGDLRGTTDRSGRFALPLEVDVRDFRAGPLVRDCALVAVKEGWSPAVLPGFGARALDVAREEEAVELVIPGAAGAIAGVLLDADGAPAEGWRIKVLDGTVIAEGDFYPLTAEEVASDPTGLFVLRPDHAQGAPPSAWRRGYHETDATGGFRFEGLALDRTYRLRAWNARTLEVVESEPIPTGTHGVLLQAPSDPPRALVDGVVVGTDGTPLEDVRCRLTMVEHRTASGTWMTSGQTVRTDALGRFAFPDVYHTESFLRFDGHEGGASVTLEPGREYRHLRVVIERPGFLRFEALDPERAPDRIAVEDAAGERLKLRHSPEPGRTETTRELPVTGGRTPRAKVHESAAWIVFLRDGREVGRRTLRILPGEETLVRD